MSRISRLAVLVTALASLFAALSATAGAVTFTNSGSTAFTATGGAGTLTVTGTAGPNNLTCASSSATGTVPSGAFTQVNGSATFSSCRLVGLETTVSCVYTLTILTNTGGNVYDGILHLNTPHRCTVSLATSPFTALCTITGSTGASYTNPSGTTKGRLTLVNSGTLVVSNSSGSSCSAAGVPAGETRPGDLLDQTINVSNGTPTTLGPVISSP